MFEKKDDWMKGVAIIGREIQWIIGGKIQWLQGVDWIIDGWLNERADEWISGR